VQPWCFLRRNTLVAALCKAALVAETGTKGGTLDTVRKLEKMRRPTFVVQLPAGAKHANAHQLLIAGGAISVAVQCNAHDVKSITHAAASSRIHAAQSPCLQLFDSAPDTLP
jgi:predicted Rossmann fold nucleotide-binding protein DprA/Smf involved in DNA uptake